MCIAPFKDKVVGVIFKKANSELHIDCNMRIIRPVFNALSGLMPRWFLAWGLVLMLILLTSPFLKATPTITIDDTRGEYSLGPYLEILEDKEKSWSIKEIVSPEIAHSFILHKEEALNLGLTSSAFWVRFQLQNHASVQKDWLLQVESPILEKVSFFILKDDGDLSGSTQWIEKKSGETIPHNEREIKHRSHLFPLALALESERTFYVRIEAEENINTLITLWSPKEFSKKDHEEQIGFGLYYGVILVMVFYNFLLFLSLRDRTYLFYVTYVGASGLFFAYFHGFAFEYLWPNNPSLNFSAYTFFGSMSVALDITFTRQFLQTKKHTPKMNIFLIIVVVTSCFVMILSRFGGNSIFVWYLNLILGLFCIPSAIVTATCRAPPFV